MKFQNLLQQADYSLVLPNEKLMPLSLIAQKKRNIFSFFSPKEGTAVNAGLNDLFYAKGRGVKYPEIKKTELPKTLAGSDIVKADTHFAAHLLSRGNVSASGGLQKAQTVLFSFKNAKEHFVNQIVLDEYLQFATLNEYAPTFAEAVKAGKMYIVLSALVAEKLILRNADDFNMSGEITVSGISRYADAKAGTETSASETYYIENEGTPLIFAVKTAKIQWENDHYRIIPAAINVRKPASSGNQNVHYFEDGAELLFE